MRQVALEVRLANTEEIALVARKTNVLANWGFNAYAITSSPVEHLCPCCIASRSVTLGRGFIWLSRPLRKLMNVSWDFLSKHRSPFLFRLSWGWGVNRDRFSSPVAFTWDKPTLISPISVTAFLRWEVCGKVTLSSLSEFAQGSLRICSGYAISVFWFLGDTDSSTHHLLDTWCQFGH